MDAPELRTVARPGSEPSTNQPTLRRTSTTSWRTISLLATPLVLGLGNLIDAYADKQQAIISGDKYYARLVGEGEEAKRLAIEGGRNVGKTKKRGIIAAAKASAQESVAGSVGKAEQRELQGISGSELMDLQAEVTMGQMRALRAVTDNALQMTRLALLEHESIEISINPKSLSDVRYVGRRAATREEWSELTRRATSDTPKLVGIAMGERYRRNLSTPNKVVVCE
jgi:hypothetical protein